MCQFLIGIDNNIQHTRLAFPEIGFHNTGLYNRDGQAPSPLRDQFIEGFEVTDQETRDLIAFLESLTDMGLLGESRYADPFPSR